MTFVEAYVVACFTAGGCSAEGALRQVHRWRSTWRNLAHGDDGTAHKTPGASPDVRSDELSSETPARLPANLAANTADSSLDVATVSTGLPYADTQPRSGPNTPGPPGAPAGPDCAQASVPRRPLCLLPPDIADFTGREEHLHHLLQLLAGSHDQFSVPIAVISGMAGVGKTALAVHLAHRLRSEFPDGQLFVNLRGTWPDPVEPLEVLSRFLRALGVDGPAIPAGLEERAEMYRALVADRKLLVVLDDAADDDAQLEKLLPGTSGCAVIATSRARLTWLPGVQAIELDVLAAHQAVDLLGRLVGGHRITTEPVAVRTLARLCGCLPLALRIAGARIAARPHTSLSHLTQRLSDERHRVEELTHGPLAVRASFALSYRTLDDRCRRLFRLLGLLDAPDIATWVAAAVLDTDPATAAACVDQLVEARLLEEERLVLTGHLRYRFHDLIRLYARHLAQTEEPPSERGAALTRALAAWLALAEQALKQAYGDDSFRIRGTAPRWRRTDIHMSSADPYTWLETERLSLVAMIRQAAQLGLDELCWELAFTATAIFSARSYFDDWQRTHQWALAATRSAGNRSGQAAILTNLGSLRVAQNQLEQAETWLNQALNMFGDTERQGRAIALTELAFIERRRGRFDAALRLFEQVHADLQETDARVMDAYVLRNIGQTHLELGAPHAAAPYLEQALTLATDASSPRVKGLILHTLGEARLANGELDAAELAFQHDLAIMRDLGDRRCEAYALDGLGRTHLSQSRHRDAESRLTQALHLTQQYKSTFIEARVLLSFGELHRAQHRLRQAADDLTQAARLFHQLDTPTWQAQAFSLLTSVHQQTADN